MFLNGFSFWPSIPIINRFRLDHIGCLLFILDKESISSLTYAGIAIPSVSAEKSVYCVATFALRGRGDFM
jgi:hypothetical protein